MGNLEKAGVLVVVVLLAIILGVAFINNGDDPSRLLNKNEQQASGASKQGDQGDGSVPQAPEPRRTSGGLEIINGDEPMNGDRASTDAPPPSPAPQEPPKREAEKPSPRPEAPPKETPKPAPVTPAPVAAEWPKRVKVEKTDTSLLAVARRVYGAKDAQAMIPAVLKQNPGLKPTALKVGQELSMPAKAAPADAKKTEAANGDTVRSEEPKKSLKKDAKPAPKSTAKNAAAKAPGKPTTKAAKAPEKRRLAFQPAR